MKTLAILIIGFMLGICLMGAIAAHAPQPAAPRLNEAALLKAIAQVESGGRLDAVGKHLEVGEYQLSQPIIEDYYNEKFGKDTWLIVQRPSESVQTEIAFFHLHQLELQNQTFDPAKLAREWNPGCSQDYVERVGNLYAKYNK